MVMLSKKWPHRDSNPNLQNRNLKFYPLNYGAGKNGQKYIVLADKANKKYRAMPALLQNHVIRKLIQLIVQALPR